MIDRSYLVGSELLLKHSGAGSEWQICEAPNGGSYLLEEGDRVRPADARMIPDHEGGEIEERHVLRGVWHAKVRWDESPTEDVPLYALMPLDD